MEHLAKLDQLKDNAIFKGLAQLLDVGVSMGAAKKAQVGEAEPGANSKIPGKQLFPKSRLQQSRSDL